MFNITGNGNIWLCVINQNITTAFRNNYGMGIPTINFSWTQIGDANTYKDLYNNGILNEVK